MKPIFISFKEVSVEVTKISSMHQFGKLTSTPHVRIDMDNGSEITVEGTLEDLHLALTRIFS